jgi:hypothetical protein
MRGGSRPTWSPYRLGRQTKTRAWTGGATQVEKLCGGTSEPRSILKFAFPATRERLCDRSVLAEARAVDLQVLQMCWDYVHPTPLVPICETPTDAEVRQNFLFAWHSMTLYAEAMPAVVIQQ